MVTFQSAVLIVNPVSGQARGLRIGQQLRTSFEKKGVTCSVRITSGMGDAKRFAATAAEDGFELIVVIGGDGTVGEVVSGQTGCTVKVPIAIVPVGTANVVALALALPWFPGQAMDTILEGRILSFDVGYLPKVDRHFFLMAALGYPANVIQDSPRHLKNLFGIFTYIGAGIRNILNLDEVKIFIEDGEGEICQCEGNTILLSNIGKIGDINFKVTPDTSAHDGKFDLTIISSRSAFEFLIVILRMLTWRHRPTSRLRHFQAEKVTIITDPPVAVQIDGEDGGYTPLEAEIIAHGVKLIVGGRYREDSDGWSFPEFHVPSSWPVSQRARSARSGRPN